jgi:hypothetical protein
VDPVLAAATVTHLISYSAALLTTTAQATAGICWRL